LSGTVQLLAEISWFPPLIRFAAPSDVFCAAYVQKDYRDFPRRLVGITNQFSRLNFLN
jgi:hypothetical protein